MAHKKIFRNHLSNCNKSHVTLNIIYHYITIRIELEIRNKFMANLILSLSFFFICDIYIISNYIISCNYELELA